MGVNMRPLSAVLAVILLLSFFRLGAVSLFDVDEAVFAEATKEMVLNDEWITPTYNGVNRYDKPILFYWLMAISYRVFGINEFGARFPSALAGAALGVCIYFFVRSVSGQLRALYAAMSFVVSFYFVIYSHAAVTDMTLSLFIALSLFSFYLSLTRERGRLYLHGFYLFSALAFLTKGLIGIVFPFGIAALYLVVGRNKSAFKSIFSPTGVLLFVAVSAPWYIAQYMVNGREFIEQFFFKHHFRRYTGVISGHKGPFYYYLPALIIGMMPWVVFLPKGVSDAVKGLRQGLTSKDPVSAPAYRLDVFALIWASAVIAFFSFSTTKLPNYILPAIPACSILISCGMAAQGERGVRLSHWVFSGAGLLLGAGLLVGEGYLVRFDIGDTLWIKALAVIMFAGSGINAYAALKGRRLFEYAGAVMLLSLLLLSYGALPAANRFLQSSLYEYSLYAKDRLSPDERTITYKINFPSIVFYSDRRVVHINDKESLISHSVAKRHSVAIARTSEKKDVEDAGFRMVREGRTFSLFEKTGE